ncbi:MAG: hypothetical protein J6R47_06950, partial [Acholeplasmatales bacterium]|nr:hypothetical protein [Acholeplasmatales bacterium]
MFNTEVPHKTSADVLNSNSQIASYFVAVDNAVSIGDTNKRYQPVNNTSYGSPPPIYPGTFTSIIISPTADNTADIYNGYINATMRVNVYLDKSISKYDPTDTITVSTTNGDGGEPVTKNVSINREFEDPYCVWVGFKDAMDAIEKYEILANGISIYTQNNAIEESFITACGMTEDIKKSNCYSHVRHKDIFNEKLHGSCGAYCDFGSILNDKGALTDYIAGKPYEINIPLKIDLRRFLPLSNIKYLPAFAGKIELRVCFSTTALVCTPVNPLSKAKFSNTVSKFAIDDVTNEFVPCGLPIHMITNYYAPTYVSPTEDADPKALAVSKLGTLRAGDVTVTARLDCTYRCESVINCFGIASDVYDELVQHYSTTPLTFPTQTLSFAPFANNLKGNPTGVTSITLTPRFVDSFFLLFPQKQCYRTVYKNPRLNSLQLQCGGYGSIPALAHGSYQSDSSQTIEELQNALNLNGDLVGLNRDVIRSLVSEETQFTTGLESDNATDFLLGFATETDNTFQQGQTSNTPITYTLAYSQSASDPYCKNVEVSPIIGILTDSTFSIQIRPDGSPPIVELGAYDITSPM